MAALIVTDRPNTMNGNTQTNVQLSKTSQNPANMQSSWRNMGPSETLVFLENSAKSFAQTGTSSYVAGKKVGVEACKWTEGRRGKKKRALTVISDSPSLSAPLPPPTTTYFLTALASVMILIHAQLSVHIFRENFSVFKPQFIQVTSDYPSSISKTYFQNIYLF